MDTELYKNWNKLIDEAWVWSEKCNTATEFFNVVSKNVSPLHSSASLIARVLVEHQKGGFKGLIQVGLGPSMYRMYMTLISLKKILMFDHYIDTLISMFKKADELYYEYLDCYEDASHSDPISLIRMASVMKQYQVLDREFVKYHERFLNSYSRYINRLID